MKKLILLICLEVGACTPESKEVGTVESYLFSIPASPATTGATAITEWEAEQIGGRIYVRGMAAEGTPILELALEGSANGTRIMAPAPAGVLMEVVEGTVLEDELTPFQRGAIAFLVTDAGGPPNEVGWNHNSWGCYQAAAAAGVACAAATLAPTPVTIAACAAAVAYVGVACSGGHCDQIECNANCTAHGNVYGWCEENEQCVCHPPLGPPAPPGPPPPPDTSCVNDWDCPANTFCSPPHCWPY